MSRNRYQRTRDPHASDEDVDPDSAHWLISPNEELERAMSRDLRWSRMLDEGGPDVYGRIMDIIRSEVSPSDVEHYVNMDADARETYMARAEGDYDRANRSTGGDPTVMAHERIRLLRLLAIDELGKRIIQSRARVGLLPELAALPRLPPRVVRQQHQNGQDMYDQLVTAYNRLPRDDGSRPAMVQSISDAISRVLDTYHDVLDDPHVMAGFDIILPYQQAFIDYATSVEHAGY
jgi:hypothetical protein